MPRINEILKSQDKQGRWIVHQDKFRKSILVQKWNGEYRVEDRISTARFNENVRELCEFLEVYQELKK